MPYWMKTWVVVRVMLLPIATVFCGCDLTQAPNVKVIYATLDKDIPIRAGKFLAFNGSAAPLIPVDGAVEVVLSGYADLTARSEDDFPHIYGKGVELELALIDKNKKEFYINIGWGRADPRSTDPQCRGPVPYWTGVIARSDGYTVHLTNSNLSIVTIRVDMLAEVWNMDTKDRSANGFVGVQAVLKYR